jgi:hypothetical protein
MTSKSKDREKKIKILKALTNEQLISELRRRRGVDHNFKLMWVHPDAFFTKPGDIEEAAKKASQEAEEAAKTTESIKEEKSK